MGNKDWLSYSKVIAAAMKSIANLPPGGDFGSIVLLGKVIVIAGGAGFILVVLCILYGLFSHEDP